MLPSASNLFVFFDYFSFIFFSLCILKPIKKLSIDSFISLPLLSPIYDLRFPIVNPTEVMPTQLTFFYSIHILYFRDFHECFALNDLSYGKTDGEM